MAPTRTPQAADAVSEVERNTKSQTTAASYTATDHDVIKAWHRRAARGRPSARSTTGGLAGSTSRFNKFVRRDG